METFFEYEKDLLGNDHYQIIPREAILRFWTLTAHLLFFLEQQCMQGEDRMLTCGDVRRKLQNEHRQNLLLWVETCFRDDLSLNKISANWLYEILKVQG